ncbi:hypothetical protein [Hymenobacter negativus]|uniref:Uncharacterized protein n=1 Tax=Hymenobacter negativus TaxID=2795026 RepID=A0ABS3QI70_9BACT|nr:hypothetical protein [Hymenobacter negativus]MBO2010935.1 hypothetical protein [Hymenobacter negativus]
MKIFWTTGCALMLAFPGSGLWSAPACVNPTEPPMVWFIPYTVDVQPQSRQHLQQFLSNLTQQDLADAYFRLQIFTCPQELQKDSLLGYKRAERLMALIGKTVAFQKEDFIIQDVSAGMFTATACESTGIGIGLRSKH